MLNKLVKFLTLEKLRGMRTKLTIIVDVVLYAVSKLLPQYVSPQTWHELQPLFVSLATLFGIEHFEPRNDD